MPQLSFKSCAKGEYMSYVPYEYPSYPNVTTRQQTNELTEGARTPIDGYASASGVAQNAVPNVYAPSGKVAPYGTNTFGANSGYNAMPQSQDIVHREITLKINEALLYRRNPGVPERDARGYRIKTATINVPPSSAKFSDGSRGDIYGS
jgi:hypothetical protein